MIALAHPPEPADDLTERLQFRVDENAPPGNVTRALASLLIDLARHRQIEIDEKAPARVQP